MKPYIESLSESIRVGPFDIRIEKWDNHAANANKRWAEFSAGEQIIRIDREMVTPFKAVDSMLHEISHAIFWAYAIMDEDKEERIVTTLATAWTQIYRDNRWLLGWIERTLHDD